MDFRLLRSFVAVAEEGSFTKAAKRLRSSESALSRHIRQLEEDVGTTLFLRDHRGVNQVTSDGRLLLHKARGLLVDAANLIDAARHASGRSRAVVRVAISWGLWDLLHDVQEAYAAKLPAVHIEGSHLPTVRQSTALELRAIDVGIVRATPLPGSLESEVLFNESFVVVMGRRHPMARHTSLSLKDLVDSPLLILDQPVALYFKTLALYSAAGLVPPETHVVPRSDESMIVRLASGRGIYLALASSWTKNAFLSSATVEIPLDEPNAVQAVNLAWRRGEDSADILAFLKTAREIVRSAR